jgi:hypothetical protein
VLSVDALTPEAPLAAATASSRRCGLLASSVVPRQPSRIPVLSSFVIAVAGTITVGGWVGDVRSWTMPLRGGKPPSPGRPVVPAVLMSPTVFVLELDFITLGECPVALAVDGGEVNPDIMG